MKKLICFLLVISSHSYAEFDTEDLKTLIAESEKKDSDVLTVWKDGKVWYTKNTDTEKKYSIQSVSKSLTALTTLCVLRNSQHDIDDSHLFKDWELSDKKNITLRHLLSMTSGIIDPSNPWGDHDYYDHAAKQPLTHAPGTKFSYANTSPMIIGKWIKESTGKQFSHHINSCFFDALGITDWKIGKDGERNEVVTGGITIRAQDLIKVGIMLIQNGTYDGQELFTPEQVHSLKEDKLSDGNGYGLGFWLWGKDIYYAEGYLGQFLIMVPKENLVILRMRNRNNMRSTDDNKLNWFNELPGLVSKLIR